MTTPSIIEVVHTGNGGGSAVVTTSAGTTQAGDKLIIVIGTGANTLANALAPTSSPSLTWTPRGTPAELSSNGGFMRVYEATVGVNGAVQITAPSNGGFNTLISAYVIRGADSSTPVDAISITTVTTSTTNPDSPSISPTGPDDQLICAALSGDASGSTFTSQPAGMTDRGNDNAFGTMATANQALVSSGATGVRTWTFANARRWIVASIAIKAPSGATVNGTGAADLGSLTGTAAGTPTVVATAVSDLGALTGTVVGTPTVVGTAAADLGTLTSTATGTPTVLATAVSDLGALTGTAAGTPTVGGTAASDLGALTSTATGTPTVLGAATSDLGPLTGTGTGQGTEGASGAADLGALTATAAGSRLVSGQGAANLGSLNAIGDSDQNPIYGQMIQANQFIGTLAVKLLQCLCEAAAANPGPPANCCFRVGFDVAQDMGALEDLCCEGLGYVALGDMYASSGSFPEQDSVRQAYAPGCPPPSWAVTFKIGLMRCTPTGDQNFPPNCDEWNLAALQNIYDTNTLTTASCCFRDYVTSGSELFDGMSIVLDRQSQGSPSGGCIERSMVITVQIPNCC